MYHAFLYITLVFFFSFTFIINLDILLLLVGITMIVTGIIGYNNDLWLWIQIVNIWFGISFVLRRLFFSKNVI